MENRKIGILDNSLVDLICNSPDPGLSTTVFLQYIGTGVPMIYD